jgi:hypothetical protein
MNSACAADIEVALDPQAAGQGHDPQLAKAVEVVMDLLKKNPPPPPPHHPPYPDYHKAEHTAAATQ